jgi:hypothetical protein
MAKMKTEDGVKFPAQDYAYVPDPDSPSTWKLRLTSTPGGAPDARIVGAAAAALGPGYRGQKVEIPAGDLAAVKAKVRAAWKEANPDRDDGEMPEGIREAAFGSGGDFVEAATFKSLIQGLVRSAGATADHKSVPKALKAKLTDLRQYLRKTYSEMPEAEDAASGTATATEASGDTSRGLEEFKEDGLLLEVDDG